jgi:hypothetical protein
LLPTRAGAAPRAPGNPCARLRLQKCSVLTVKVAKELAWYASHRGERAGGKTTRTSPKDDSEACRLKTSPKHVRKMTLGQPQELAILQANTKPSNKTSSTSIECSIVSRIMIGHSKPSLGMRQVEEHACPGLTAYVSERQHISQHTSACVKCRSMRVHALLRVSYPSASCLVPFFKSASAILQSACCCCNRHLLRRRRCAGAYERRLENVGVEVLEAGSLELAMLTSTMLTYADVC